MATGLKGIGDNLGKMKEEFKNCPLCEKEFHYPEYGDGPLGSVQIEVNGHSGSNRHDCGSRNTFVCNDCADIVFALLKIFDMNDDLAIQMYPEHNVDVVPEREKLLKLRQRLIHSLNVSKNISG